MRDSEAPAASVVMAEDDAIVRDLMVTLLEGAGYRATPCGDGSELEAVLRSETPDLIVLDVMLPGEDGLSICRRLSAERNVPILIVSARGEAADRVAGLEIGADDYLAKPFDEKELLARVKALLRRSRRAHRAGHIYRFDGWTLNLEQRALTDPSGTAVYLTTAEYTLLAALVARPHEVLDRDELSEAVLGRPTEPGDRIIDVQMSRLRRKLGDNPKAPHLIQTVRGGGYIMTATVEVS